MTPKPQILDAFGRPARAAGGQPVAFWEASRQTHKRSSASAVQQRATRDVTPLVLGELRKKSLYLYRNSPVIRGIVERFKTYVVGTGLWPFSNSQSKAWKKAVNASFRRFARTPDVQSRISLSRWQRMVFGCQLLGGDSFALKTFGNGDRPRWQCLEAFTIASRRGQVTADQPDGITLDAIGRPASYQYTPDEGRTFYDLPADKVVQFWTPERPAQYRGLPILQAAINYGYDLDDILALEMEAVKDNSSRKDIVKRAQGMVDPEAVARGDVIFDPDKAEKYYEKVLGAESVTLLPGDEYTPNVPQRPSPAWVGYVEFVTDAIVLCLNMPPSLMLATKMGGADTRRDLATAARVIAEYQEAIVDPTRELYEYWIESEIDRGFLKNPPDDYLEVKFQTPKDATVDDGREAAQDRENVRAGLMTLEEYCGRWGIDWREHVEQLGSELEEIIGEETRRKFPKGLMVNRAFSTPSAQAIPVPLPAPANAPTRPTTPKPAAADA